MSFKTRRQEGKIHIVELNCPYCNHNKAWSKPKGIFCCKCQMEIKEKPKTKILGELFTDWKDRGWLSKK